MLALACAVPDDPAQMFGLWANTDDGFVRAWDLAEAHDELPGVTPAYRIYNYDEGTDPVVAQTGRYDVREEHIVTSPTGESVDYSNELVGWGGDWFELIVDKDTGAIRRYDLVDDLP